MKKSIVCFLALAMLQQTSAQTTALSEKEIFWQKSKHQRTAAWVLLGGGTILTIIGATIYTSSAANQRQLGHYAEKDVLLDAAHLNLLKETFTLFNHSPRYQHHPTMLYHDYHQRRVGCFAGSRSVYIGSAGDVHARPFCHTRSYNIISLVRANEMMLPQKENQCPRFGKIS